MEMSGIGDLEEVHKRFAAEDSCFSSGLIVDSEDSSNLCVAYAQRNISEASNGVAIIAGIDRSFHLS